MESSTQQNRISKVAHNVTDSSRQLVEGHPVSTALTVFGTGLALGIVLASVTAAGVSRRQQQGVAHRLGRQMLEVLGNVPESLSKLGS